ncbi:MAG: 2-amino-4-hydroxy-6-hydroxymethyldihydropteridine diphosphokinase [Victivallales bacterium]|jgi:2-amino-4-hydroxy-6-hydroxymethyldihydropteridine diphosphokinase
MQTEVALSLGGNTGNVPLSFRRALEKLRAGGLCEIRISSLYRTAPVGCANGTPDFINAAATGKWNGSLASLHSLCMEIEVETGRPANHVKYASRTLDLDIVFFGDMIYSDGKITVPHREAKHRLFVLIPLAEIAGDRLFPGEKSSVSEILEKQAETAEYGNIMKTRFSLS